MIAVVRTLSTFLCLTSNVAAMGRRPRFEPLPICEVCVPREDILAPGIGFDLTTSYGTAAIRYYDGSVETLGKVNADDDYKHLMVTLSDPSSNAKCTGDHWGEVHCLAARAKRRWNKLLGRPSTPEVGTIAKLVENLRFVVEDKLEPISMKKVLITIPYLPGLSYEDLQDAAEYAGLTLLTTHKNIPDQVSEVSAAFAGSGHGLCEHYDDLDSCEDEEADMPYSQILALSLSQTSFSAAYTFMQSAYRSIIEKETTRFDLGLMHCPTTDEEKEALYWSQVQDSIVKVGRATRERLTVLLILGEDGTNRAFIRTVKDALRELHSNTEASTVFVSGSGNGEIDPLYVAAKGAAELAKRAQEAPAGCKEAAHCAVNRIPPENALPKQVLLSKGGQKVELEL